MRFFLTALMIAFSLLSAAAFAQSDEDRQFLLKSEPQSRHALYEREFEAATYQPLYNQAVRRAVVAWPVPYNFWEMRDYYIRTRQYDPLGEDTLTKLRALAYETEQAKTEADKAKKAGEFKDLALDHLGHVDVMLQAMALARENPLYGDPDFYQWVLKGMEEEMLTRNKGRSLKDAYFIITFADQALIMNRLKVKSVFSEVVGNDRRFYTIHLVEELKSGKQYELFFDTTFPMRRLKAAYVQKEFKPKPLDLRGIKGQ
ncbi:MAG TPA: hypothetical protein PLO23_06575 [Alphaproteobacteria bacterium]|nr:hypothetical protein [Alphaproteobacteria bacterium]